MKQLLILSGKGGTGKTTVAGAFIKLSAAKAYADCDVDAPNLHLIMGQESNPKKTDYFGMPKAVINTEKCTGCGLCKENCRFNAVSDKNGYRIDPYACEGCGVCEVICPVSAVLMKPAVSGELMLYEDENKIFSTAKLKMGGGNSGKLVTEVKKQMREAAMPDTEFAVIDGSPGIGCPVIASLSGVDIVLIVAEPSVSGISDMERIIKTAGTFRTGIAVCINKHDVDPTNTGKIEEFCRKNNIHLAGKIPFDPTAIIAVNNGQTIADIDCPSGAAAREIFGSIMKLLFDESDGNIK